jgi:hypothetical protein
MRMILVLTLVVASVGCNKLKPAPIVVPRVPADNPSILVNPPYPGESQTGAKPNFPKMLAVGGSRSNNDRIAGTYEAFQDFSVGRADKSDADPREIAAEIRRWIQNAPRVTVTAVSEDSSDPGKIRCTIDYQTPGTVGYAVYAIEPTTPARGIRYTLQIRERRR